MKCPVTSFDCITCETECDLLKKQAKKHGYDPVRQFPNGLIAGISDYLFTAGLFVGIDHMGYLTRYCYENRADAEAALAAWDGTGDPPGPWIKQKPEERNNPNFDWKG